MNNLNILVLSDIHLHKMEANDQGLVLSGLFKDLESQLPISERENNWCFIAGDLVQAGIETLYNDFMNNNDSVKITEVVES
ncbi:metallophosphoesterase [uncultured Bacteroides sp.]|uniref:metallophosphoesterase n=1 Tax=uncultured Bacteroides sp. TaxID=162156 RepID=UPI0032203E93